MAKVELIRKNNVHSEAYQYLRRLDSIATTLHRTLHVLKKAEGAYYSAHWSMYDLQDQKFYVRCELEKINEDIRILKNNIKQSNREYEKAMVKMLSEGMS